MPGWLLACNPRSMAIRSRGNAELAANGCNRMRKDGKEHEAPCITKLETYIDKYIAAAASRAITKGRCSAPRGARPAHRTG